MKVYGLCTEMIGKTLTLWCIGEKKEVPQTINERNHVTTYYSDINEAKKTYLTCKGHLSSQGYTCADNT
jgi:hypothetical protein